MGRIRLNGIAFALTVAAVALLGSAGQTGVRPGQRVLATGFAETTHVAAGRGYAFSDDGDYVAIDVQSYKTSEKLSLWKQILESPSHDKRFQSFAGSQPLRVVADPREGRAFVLAGVPRSELLLGYVIVSLENLKPLGVILQQMKLGTAFLGFNPTRRKIHLSYLSTKEDREGKSSIETVVYNSQDFREIARYKDSDLIIQSSSCFSADGAELYTNQRVFDTATDALVKKLSLSGKPFLPVACHNARLLLLSKAEDGFTVLVIYDAHSDQVLKQIKTAIPFRADADPWVLSVDGQLVVFDERRLVPVGEGQALERTGRLQFFSVASGLKSGELRVGDPGVLDSGIVDLSLDGSILFYQSGTRLSVVSLSAMSVLAEIPLPFRPIGIVWP